MKIKEVLLKEFDDGGFNPMGDVTTGMPSASPTAVAAPAPAQAGQAKWPTTRAEIIAFQKANKLKPDGLIGKNTMAALQKAGATPPPGFNPVGPKAAKAPAAKAPASKPAADPNQAAIDASNAANQQAVQQQKQNYAQADAATAPDRFAGQAGTDAQTGQNNLGTDIHRLAQLAGTMRRDTPPPNVNALGIAAQAGPAFGQQAATGDKPMGQGPNVNALGVAAQGGPNPFGQQAATGDKPMGQGPNVPPGLASATTPQGNTSTPAGPTATANPDGTGDGTTSGQAAQPVKDPTVAPPVATGKDGTGPGLKDGSGKPVTSSSDDELAWVAKNGGSLANRSMYPGPGNWDPKTGRTTNAADKALAASGANPWDGKDPAKAAAWAALSPEDQKWIGKGDPTDKAILARAPSKGGFLGSLGFGKKPDPVTPTAQGDQSGGSTTGNKAFLPGAAGGAKEDIARLRKLSGLE